MPGKVALRVTAGPLNGRSFEFSAHDTFLFGRSPDCHAQLDPSDTTASRHHFLLEVNPPTARLRDLGSLNGTLVNGVRFGGRARHLGPQEAPPTGQVEIDLQHGDQVRVGHTYFQVTIEAPPSCCECGVAIAAADQEECAWVAGTFLCAPCRAKGVGFAPLAPPSLKAPVPARASAPRRTPGSPVRSRRPSPGTADRGRCPPPRRTPPAPRPGWRRRTRSTRAGPRSRPGSACGPPAPGRRSAGRSPPARWAGLPGGPGGARDRRSGRR
ncbi:MAG: FHA domain-containing protein [Vicinamibacteria bacterium]